MNYTRLMWGGDQDLNCTQHDRDDMPVLLTSFIILTVPLLFYGASCICGERRKLKLMTREQLILICFINREVWGMGLVVWVKRYFPYVYIFLSFLFHFSPYLTYVSLKPMYLPYISFKTVCSNPYFSLTWKKAIYLFCEVPVLLGTEFLKFLCIYS